jgi:phosphatidylserine/phosphatidylglycerophosphate/cardiolipin synthase-like enzyme
VIHQIADAYLPRPARASRRPGRAIAVTVVSLTLLAATLSSGHATPESRGTATAPGARAAVEPPTALLAARERGDRRKAPTNRVTFNDPTGSQNVRYAMIREVDHLIRSTPRRATIRITGYNIDQRSITDSLIAAHRRGVNVRVLMDDVHNTKAMRRMQRVFGSRLSNRSYFRWCTHGCRTRRGGGSLHTKMYLFSTTGGRRHVVVVSSSNLTKPGANWGWNDQVTLVEREAFYLNSAAVFEEMARDVNRRTPYRTFSGGPYTAYVFPKPTGGDPVLGILHQVRCTGAKGAGRGGRTVIRVAMFAWFHDRGLAIAEKLRALDNAGCIVQVIWGAPGRGVSAEVRRLGRNGGIEARDSRFDRDGDGRKDLYVHHKFFTISGVLGANRSARAVFTGSANWMNRPLRHDDEIMLRVNGSRVYERFDDRFTRIWRYHSTPRPNRRLSALSTLSLGPGPWAGMPERE